MLCLVLHSPSDVFSHHSFKHLWRTCCFPSLISGLPALPIRPSNMKPLEIFQRKVLRGFLKLSKSSPIPALHFLLGELPVEGVLHIRTLGLLYNIWSNPTTTVHSMVVYSKSSRCPVITPPHGPTMSKSSVKSMAFPLHSLSSRHQHGQRKTGTLWLRQG